MSAKKGKDNPNGAPPPLPPQQQQQQAMPPPFMPPPTQMQYPGAPPPGYAPFPPGPPVDPNQQQQLLQIQIRQQQLQLQQMQQQQAAAAAQHQQQQRMPPPKLQQQQQFASFTTTTTPHAVHTNKHSSPQAAPAPPPPPPNLSKKRKSPLPAIPKKHAPPPPSSEQVKQWLAQCDWKDKTIYVSRQIMGGSSINGFARATSTVQRIKKQRARQVAALHKKKAEAQAPIPLPEQSPLEIQKEILNPRTAKKMRLEFQQGAAFCQNVYETIQGIMRELDPASVPPPIQRLTSVVPKVPSHAKRSSSTSVKPTTTLYSNKPKTKTSSTTAPPAAKVARRAIAPPPPPILPGSILRKQRKRKLAIPPLQVNLSEHDATGKRIFTKREHNLRIAEVLRFRALRAGDYVAAKTSSRDLWILARVLQDYPAFTMNATEFLKLTLAKRDALFKDKVMVKDAEEKAAAEPIVLSRQLVLPLPRTYGEAAEWGTRLKKGLRIYAMYPHTTSLYVATVVDNTTYCRGDDDIIVVEFDEDERDASGALPKCHIPARFAVMIPREYQTTKKASASEAKQQSKRASKKAATTSVAQQQPTQSDLALNNMLGDMNDAMDDFQALVDFGPGGSGV